MCVKKQEPPRAAPQPFMHTTTNNISALARLLAALCLLIASAVPSWAQPKTGLYEWLVGLPDGEVEQKAQAYVNAGNIDSAEVCYMTIAARYGDGIGEAGKKACAESLNNLGAIAFAYRHNYISSFSFLVKALRIAEDIDYGILKPYVYCNLANVHAAFGDSAMSGRLYRESFWISKRLGDVYSYETAFVELVYMSVVDGGFGVVSEEFDDFGKAYAARKVDRSGYAARIYSGVKAYSAGRLGVAFKAFDAAAGKAGGVLEGKTNKLVADMLAAKVYAARGEYLKAVARLRPNIRPDMYQHALNDIYRAMSAYYAKAGLADSAKEYKVKSLLINDSALNYNEYMRLRDIELRYLPESADGAAPSGGIHVGVWIAAVLALAVLIAAAAWPIVRRRRRAHALHEGGTAVAVPHGTACATASDGAQACPGADGKAHELALAIRRYMETSPEIYGQDFSLDKLAAAVGAHTRMVSRTVNDVFGVNFSTLLSQYRIKEACRRLSSPEYANVTIQSIAVDMGFKSRTNFAAVFKRETGLTPNEYQKEALRKAYQK